MICDMDGRTRPLLIRFLEKIQVSDTEWHNGTPCWLWAGGGCEPRVKRAGKVYLDGSRRKQTVHVAAYELFIGPIPDSKGVARLCSNWQCCSPLHLVAEAGTRPRIKKATSSPLGRSLGSIRVEGDCWIAPGRTGPNKSRVYPKSLLVKYFLGEPPEGSMRERTCSSSDCVNPLHYQDVDRKEKVRDARRKYYQSQPLKDVDCRQCGKTFKAKKKGGICFKCLKKRLSNKERACRKCGQLFKGERCNLCLKAKLKANPRACAICGYVWAGKGRCRKCRYANLRRTALNAYGGKCYCCGESDYRFLTFDHRNNDGYRHTSKSGRRLGGISLVMWAIRNNYPDRLQVACYNCNSGRDKEPNKKCPHANFKQYAFVWRDGLTSNQRARKRERIKAIQAYGGKCVCCGETNAGFLTLDHVNDDGSEHRRSSGKTVFKLAVWARQNGYPDTLRLLCYNCNCGREQQPDKICPHQKPLSDLRAA